MARTIQEIYDQIIQEKEQMTSLNGLQPNVDSSQTLLNDLSSASKVAVWRLIFWVFAFATWWHEQLFDELKLEVEVRASEIIPSTTPWYRDQALIFQYGDPLVWTEIRPDVSKYVFSPVNTANRIIKRAAVIEIGGQVRFKVAKLDGAGLPIPLIPAELASFNAYVQDIKIAGTNTDVISIDADDLIIQVDVFYNPLVLTSSGESILNPGMFPVEVAIRDYIQQLPFNGSLDLNSLVDAMQAVDGVESPFINSAEARSLLNPFQSFSDFYTSEAGHMRLDPSTPISTMINYQL